MKQQGHVEADPKELEKIRSTWLGFTDLMKWSVIGAGAVLVLMALFLL